MCAIIPHRIAVFKYCRTKEKRSFSRDRLFSLNLRFLGMFSRCHATFVIVFTCMCSEQEQFSEKKSDQGAYEKLFSDHYVT